MSLSGPPWRYAIDRPSGLHAGRLSVSGSLSGPSNIVSWRGAALPPGAASITYRSQLLSRSASGRRLLTKTSDLPSGDLAVEQPELGVLVVAAREEREPSPVGAPTRRVLTRFRGGQADVARAVPVRHPDRALVPILGRVRRRNRVRHPGAVR